MAADLWERGSGEEVDVLFALPSVNVDEDVLRLSRPPPALAFGSPRAQSTQDFSEYLVLWQEIRAGQDSLKAILEHQLDALSHRLVNIEAQLCHLSHHRVGPGAPDQKEGKRPPPAEAAKNLPEAPQAGDGAESSKVRAEEPAEQSRRKNAHLHDGQQQLERPVDSSIIFGAVSEQSGLPSKARSWASNASASAKELFGPVPLRKGFSSLSQASRQAKLSRNAQSPSSSNSSKSPTSPKSHMLQGSLKAVEQMTMQNIFFPKGKLGRKHSGFDVVAAERQMSNETTLFNPPATSSKSAKLMLPVPTSAGHSCGGATSAEGASARAAGVFASRISEGDEATVQDEQRQGKKEIHETDQDGDDAGLDEDFPTRHKTTDKMSGGSSPRRMFNVLWKARQTKLISFRLSQSSTFGEGSQPLRLQLLERHLLKLPAWVLKLCGAVHFGDGVLATLYWWLAPVLPLLLLFSAVVRAGTADAKLFPALVTACHTLGSLVGLLFVRWRAKKDGPDWVNPLRWHVKKNGFYMVWLRHSTRQFWITVLVWGCMATCRIWLDRSDCPGVAVQAYTPRQEVADLTTFLVSTALFAALVYLVLQASCGLELAVDNFTVSAMTDVDYNRIITDWNVVQALMRFEAGNVDYCFLALGTSTVMTLLLTGVSILRQEAPSMTASDQQWQCSALWSGWILPPVFLLLYAVFRAANVTELCLRVPSLVNSWNVEDGEAIDESRLHAVQHLTLSDAGFYMCGVRLTASVALKLAYVLGAVLFTFISRAVLKA